MGVAGRLICRSGGQAGSRYELNGETFVGKDAAGTGVVAASPPAHPHARIFVRDDAFCIEDAGGGVVVDGVQARDAVRLERMHVLVIAGVEYVFSRSTAAAPAPTGSAPAPTGSAPVSTSSAPVSTSSAPVSTSSAPVSKDDTAAPAGAPPQPSKAPPKPEELRSTPAEPAAAAAPPADESGGTVVDMLGFGALPRLGLPVSDAELPAQAPAQPATGVDDGGTVVDMAGFGALPDLAPREAAAAPEPSPAAAPMAQPMTQAATPTAENPATHAEKPPTPAAEKAATAAAPDPDATVAMPTVLFELAVNVPGRGRQVYALKPGDNVIGRGADCDIVIDDAEMWLSRRHALVRVGAGGAELQDLGARNGTFVKGERVQHAALAPGSTFVLGPHLEFTLQIR